MIWIFLIAFSTCVVISELGFRFFRFSRLLARKINHICGSIVSLFLPNHLQFWELLVMASVFFITFLISKKLGFLKHLETFGEKSYGQYYFVLGILASFGIYSLSLNLAGFYLSILALGISDTLAIFGPWLKVKFKLFNAKFDQYFTPKTLAGSTIFLLTNISLVFFVGYKFQFSTVKLISLICLLYPISILELLSKKGLDNLTIPVSMYLSVLLVSFV